MIILLMILIGGMLWLVILIAQTPNTPIPKPEWYYESLKCDNNSLEVKDGR